MEPFLHMKFLSKLCLGLENTDCPITELGTSSIIADAAVGTSWRGSGLVSGVPVPRGLWQREGGREEGEEEEGKGGKERRRWAGKKGEIEKGGPERSRGGGWRQ